jgi:signal transduction histidine kinase
MTGPPAGVSAPLLTGERRTAQGRLERLLEANRMIIGELSLPAVLQRIAQVAQDLVGARSAALGVIGDDGRVRELIQLGPGAATTATFMDLPLGRGVPGSLGVALGSRNTVYGHLHLRSNRGEGFTAEDEDLLLALAGTAGVAIENARLQEESVRREAWLQASADVSGVLLSPGGDRDPLQLIVNMTRLLADADVATLVLPVDPGLLRVAVAAGDGEAELRGMEYPLPDTLVALALDTGRGVRVGALEQQQGYNVHLSRVVEVGPVMAVPLVGAAGPRGAIMLGRRAGRRNFTTADQDMAEVFANHAALARELVEARGNQQRLAVLEDRDRIARDLHDHVIQRLFATGLSVQSLALQTDDPVAAARLDRVVGDLDKTIEQVRTSIFQLQAGETGDPGLRTAVLAVVGQLVPTLGCAPSVRFTGPVETLIHGSVIGEIEAVTREGLTNVAKHAGASRVSLEVSAAAGWLSLRIVDDGVGLQDPHRSSGLDNLRHRAASLGGSSLIEDRPEGGTTLTWTIPIPD